MVIIVVQLQLSYLFPLGYACTIPHHSHSDFPCCPCPWVFYFCSFSCPFAFFPLLSHTPSLLVTFSLFFISKCLVLFCSLLCFVDYIPLIGEIIRYLSFTAWLISLSIMLSSSIHAVTKDRNSFFLLWNTPFFKCTTVVWSTHLLMGT